MSDESSFSMTDAVAVPTCQKHGVKHLFGTECAAMDTGYAKVEQDFLAYLRRTIQISRKLWLEYEGTVLAEYYRGSFNAESFMMSAIKNGEIRKQYVD